MVTSKIVLVTDPLQEGYRYVLSTPTGKEYAPEFNPDLTPKQMLELGV